MQSFFILTGLQGGTLSTIPCMATGSAHSIGYLNASRGSHRVDFPSAGNVVSPLERARSTLAKHRDDAVDLDHKQAIVALKIDRNSTLGIEEYLVIFGQGNLW